MCVCVFLRKKNLIINWDCKEYIFTEHVSTSENVFYKFCIFIPYFYFILRNTMVFE